MNRAREIIAAWVNFGDPTTSEHHLTAADELLSALHSAGMKVLPREPTEEMADAARPLFLFYGPPKVNFTLGQHIDSGTRKIDLTEDERKLNYLNKATLGALAWRAAWDAAP